MKNFILFFSVVLFSFMTNVQSVTGINNRTDRSENYVMDSLANNMDFCYKIPGGYRICRDFDDKYYGYIYIGDNSPSELSRGIGNTQNSLWVHEDKECILFINSKGSFTKDGKPDKSITEQPTATFNRISFFLKIRNSFARDITPEERAELDKVLVIWPEERAKEVFNAQYVLEYPYNDEKAKFQEKYQLRRGVCIEKWGNHLTISILTTDKGYENIDSYMKDIESAFRFND